MKNSTFKRYTHVMNQVDISEKARQKIVHSCAAYATLDKIKSGKFTVTAVVKEESTDRV